MRTEDELTPRLANPKPMSTAVPKEKLYLVGARSGRETPELVDEHLDELERLVDTAGGVVVGRSVQELRTVTPATLIGSGKVEEVREAVLQLGASAVIFDHPLTPAQQRNLTEKLGVKVLERAQLILDIFVRGARTHEAKVQVELAQMEYLLPRLAGLWKHLERQVGGIGVRGGAGEAQIELDRRIIRENIARLKRRLETIRTQRKTQRKRRTGAFRVALVGYTNAGKSTLLNRLTGADVYIADQLFATLDPSVKAFGDGAGGNVLLIDTVGFIRKLPHQLVASFRSTLEEVLEADLLLLVADSASASLDDQLRVVGEVLDEIGAAAVPRQLVLNQIDRLAPEAAQHLQALYPSAQLVSARTGQGIDGLQRLLLEQRLLWKERRRIEHEEARTRAAGEAARREAEKLEADEAEEPEEPAGPHDGEQSA
jgi:GTPase